MGFEPPENAYKLTFADGPYTGLEVTIRGFDMGKVLENRARSRNGTDSAERDPVAEEIDLLVEYIDSWNVTKRGVALDPTRENILAQSPDMVRAILREWTAAVTGVPGPLGEPSTNGAMLPPPEVSIPMETSSPNPPS